MSLYNAMMCAMITLDGSDYTSTSQDVMFSSTVMRQCIDIPILDDSISEDPESFSVHLMTDDSDVISSVIYAVVSIIDDDRVTVGLERDVYQSSEDLGLAEVCVVVVDGELNREITLSLTTSSGTAQGEYTQFIQIGVGKRTRGEEGEGQGNNLHANTLFSAYAC